MLVFVVNGLVAGTLYGLIAMGLVVVHRGTRVFNFAHGDIGMVGAFTFLWLWADHHVPLPLALLAGLAVSAGLGLTVERLVVQPLAGAPRVNLMAATLAVSGVLLTLAGRIWGFVPRPVAPPLGAGGVRLAGVFISRWDLVAIVAGVAIAAGFLTFFSRSELGLAIRASAEQPEAVRLQGFDPRALSAVTWVLASVLAGAAAVLIAPHLGSVHPGFMTLMLVSGLAAALLGGIDSAPGAFAGGLVIGVLESVIQSQVNVPGLPQALMFLTIVCVLSLQPRGVFGDRAPARLV